MIKIAENSIVRDQVKKVAPERGMVPRVNAADKLEQFSPEYPAKALVLDGGRYYPADIKK